MVTREFPKPAELLELMQFPSGDAETGGHTGGRQP